MPITLEIRGMRSSDIDCLISWRPSSLEEIFYPLEIDIAEKGSAGTEVFGVLVTSPEALRKKAEVYKNSDCPFPDRNVLVFPDYNWALVEQRVKRIVASCARESWSESVVCLNRYFRWEFEDYFRFPPA